MDFLGELFSGNKLMVSSKVMFLFLGGLPIRHRNRSVSVSTSGWFGDCVWVLCKAILTGIGGPSTG